MASPEPSLCLLLNLPHEILDIVFNHIRPSLASLGAIGQTCHSLHLLSTPVLYRCVALYDLEHTSQFSWAIDNSKHLIPLIRELQIHYHDLPNYDDDFINNDDDIDDPDSSKYPFPEDVHPVIAKLNSLESLTIKSNIFDDMRGPTELLLKAPELFPRLRTFDIGYDFRIMLWNFSFDFHPYQYILLHPALEVLIVRGCMSNFVWREEEIRGSMLELRERSTPLQELQLLNCAASPQDIEDLTRYVPDLKHFILRGRPPSIETGFQGQCDDRNKYVQILKRFSTTLETMELYFWQPWEQSVSFRSFTALKSLTIAPRYAIGESQDTCGGKKADANQWGQLLPSNLEHLVLRSTDEEEFPIWGIYELVRRGALRLSSFRCELERWTTDEREHLKPLPDHILWDKGPSGRPVTQEFRDLGVHFSYSTYCWEHVLPENDKCPCKCWRSRYNWRRY